MGFFLEDCFESIANGLPDNTLLCEFFLFNTRETASYINPSLSELGNSQITDVKLNTTKDQYCDKVKIAQSFLYLGESYELNLTFDVEIQATGDPFLLYQKLKRKQRTRCSSFFHSSGSYKLSLSPEIFWEIRDGLIKTFPMKGTAPRKPSLSEDLEAASQLQNSEKERAENVMITDLFRNDLGKISEIGSVEVISLFKTEPFESVWQMTSEIDSKLLPNLSISSLFQNLFPSGSVTGAPKKRSMEILHNLETRIRGLYTGSLLTLSRDNNHLNSKANVSIRTLILEKEGELLSGFYGVGSGITVLANPEKEYEECISKIAFLTSLDIPDFEILETIRFFSGRFRFLKYHLDRMKASCQRLGFPFDEFKARETLESISQVANGLLRIRLLINRKGDFRAESFDFSRTDKRRHVNIGYAKSKLNSKNLFLYHKTTIRDIYLAELEIGSKEGSEDVILLDEDGNISETCLRNIFYRFDGKWYTPSLKKGGLPGTLRQKMLDKKWIGIRDLKLPELIFAEKVLVGNSLRGLERIRLRSL